MTTDQTDILADLNPHQQSAVTTLHGPLMVLAGAGSGKTRVLTRRLAYLLLQGNAYPSEILAVTFTNKAAREMSGRVGVLLQASGRSVEPMWIGTFHGMAARMLRRHGRALGYESDFTILDVADQERLIAQLHKESSFKSKYWTPKRLVNAFSRWKDDGLGPADLSEQLAGLYRSDVEPVRTLFQSYQDNLQRMGAMDFGDLLCKCLALWQVEPEVLSKYQSRFRFILVDEYQDTNLIQYQWIRQLSAGHGNLCVVGDDDQTIYTWRGARLDNMLTFQQDYPGTQVVRLEQNYRSTGNILRAAGAVIRNNACRLDKTLWTEGDEGHPVEMYVATDGMEEAEFVAGEIRKLCSDGGFDRCAVLVRASRQTREFEDAFLSNGIPYQVVGGMRFLDRAEIKDALAYLRLAQSDRDDLAFERIINTPRRGLGPKAIATIRNRAIDMGLPLLGGARHVVSEQLLGGAGLRHLSQFVELIDRTRIQMDADQNPDQVLNFLMEQSGYNAYLHAQEDGQERVDNLQELHTVLAGYPDLGLFLEEAALVADLGQAQEDPEHQGPRRVVISTLHAAKGLEFPVVFLVGLEEGMLPHQFAIQSSDAKDGVEEERRLAYVGMTRAKERLYLSHAQTRWNYRERIHARPSRFLAELPPNAIQVRGLNVQVPRPLARGYF
jgi:DNA helicase-2/ATP-dependent DNA helicase PcrA